MTNLVKLTTLILAGLSVTVGGLWIHERRESSVAAERVQTLTEDNLQLSTSREGLREANEDLRRQLREVRVIPARELVSFEVEESAIPAFQWEEEEEEGVGGGSVEERRAMSRGEERGLTPAEEAEAAEREAQQAARREAWRERREAYRERVSEEARYRRAFFEQVSMEGLAPEYRRRHERLLEAMEEVDELMASMSDTEMDREERREMGRELRETAREVRELMGTQREILLNDYAQAMGYEGEEVREFIDYIETINEMTSMGGFMRGGRR